MRSIKVPAGIGDNIWLIQKLINSTEQFHFILPENMPQRGKQIFDILPAIGTAEYAGKRGYAEIKQKNICNRYSNFNDIPEKHFYLSCNEHLEEGRRIEGFLPDLETSFLIPWQTDKYYEQAVDLIDIQDNEQQLIGLYGSSYKTSRTWGFWDAQQWFELAAMIHARKPGRYKFVVIGADWDLDLGTNLISMLKTFDIPVVNCIGKELGVVVEVMQQLDYFFSFPSGLGILAPTVSCPTTMFYPNGKNGSPDLSLMLNTWASPDAIKSGEYKGCLFCPTKKIFEWVIENGWIL